MTTKVAPDDVVKQRLPFRTCPRRTDQPRDQQLVSVHLRDQQSRQYLKSTCAASHQRQLLMHWTWFSSKAIHRSLSQAPLLSTFGVVVWVFHPVPSDGHRAVTTSFPKTSSRYNHTNTLAQINKLVVENLQTASLLFYQLLLQLSIIVNNPKLLLD